MTGFTERLKNKGNTEKSCRLFKVNLKTIFILPIKIYQWCISPYLGQNCRHYPTCSNYAIEATQEWGVLKGVLIGIKRISQCHPLGKSGYDPVPKKEKKKNCNH